MHGSFDQAVHFIDREREALAHEEFLNKRFLLLSHPRLVENLLGGLDSNHDPGLDCLELIRINFGLDHRD